MAPDPTSGGGMAASLRALVESPLSRSYELEVVPTYRSVARRGEAAPETSATGARALLQIGVFSRSLLRLTAWSLLGRGRLVHIHSTVRGSAYRKSVCVLLAKALRRRVILQIHSGPGDIAAFRSKLGAPGRLLIGAATRHADAVLAVSAASAAALREAGVSREIEVVPNAAPPPPPASASADRGGQVRVAYLGGFANPAKGGDVLVEALRSIAPAELPPITLAGAGEPPAAAGELIGRDRVTWAGWLSGAEKDALLASASILVIPSRSEGLPMALLEAMSWGMAVIATRVGGIPEAIESGEDGLLVEPGDSEGLAQGLRTLAGDPGLCERLGERARGRAARFGREEVAERLAALYARLS
jgi:glycosyltransferase involved in cell wall biosynthesis